MYDDEWKDFGYNRSKVLEYAFTAPSEWLMTFDADDRISGKLELPNMNKMKHATLPTMFSLQIGTGFTYSRPFIYSNEHKWKYVGVLHEYVDLVNKGDKHCILHQGNYHIESRREGDRSKDPDKYLKDAKILEKAIEEEKDEDLKVRYTFYCAQSYKDCRHFEKSIEMYLKRTNMGGYMEEVYLSRFYMQVE